MVVLLLALVPALVVLFYYYHRDRHPEPWSWVAVVFILGALACVPAYPLERWVQSFFPYPPESFGALFLECLLIPGVIESMSNRIEHPELVAERIVRFAKIVGRENVIAGSDCGFGTFVGVALVEPEIAWAKLAALAEGARLASQELW